MWVLSEDKQYSSILRVLWAATCKKWDPVQFSVVAGGKSAGAW
jgi:hypothetical protein